MTTQILALAVVVVLSGAGAAQPQEPKASQTIADYLKMPPDEAVDAIRQALAQMKDPRQRADLVEELGRNIGTKKAVELLCDLLKDPDTEVRWYAIRGLRGRALRTLRVGPQRKQMHRDPMSGEEKERAARRAMADHVPINIDRMVEPLNERTEPLVEFAPEVEGLVPYLVAAANDTVEKNRISALYALADTRDPLAVAELRRRLKDPSENVRFYAACFLTEYQDASGLPEMQAALARLRRINPDWDIREHFELHELYLQAELLMASFERVTGKGFGPMPLNPIASMSISKRETVESRKRYLALLDTWAQWWAWQPPAHP